MSQITTHILDTSAGRPASGVSAVLFVSGDGEMQEIASGKTDADGRITQWLDPETRLPAGECRIRFETQAYFETLGVQAFYPFVDIVFTITADGEHYHVPLLLNPFGYSTYRGS